jgi:hypothetical protein
MRMQHVLMLASIASGMVTGSPAPASGPAAHQRVAVAPAEASSRTMSASKVELQDSHDVSGRSSDLAHPVDPSSGALVPMALSRHTQAVALPWYRSKQRQRTPQLLR